MDQFTTYSGAGYWRKISGHGGVFLAIRKGLLILMCLTPLLSCSSSSRPEQTAESAFPGLADDLSRLEEICAPDPSPEYISTDEAIDVAKSALPVGFSRALLVNIVEPPLTELGQGLPAPAGSPRIPVYLVYSAAPDLRADAVNQGADIGILVGARDGEFLTMVSFESALAVDVESCR